MIYRLAVIAMALIPIQSNAEWTFHAKKDEMTDRVTKMAVLPVSSGLAMFITKSPIDDKALITFAMTEGSLDIFGHDKPIQYRVDSLPVRELNLKTAQAIPSLKPFYSWSPRMVRGVAWHGKPTPEKQCGFFSELLNNPSKLTVRYTDLQDIARTFSTESLGKVEAVFEALEIKIEDCKNNT